MIACYEKPYVWTTANRDVGKSLPKAALMNDAKWTGCKALQAIKGPFYFLVITWAFETTCAVSLSDEGVR
jgi:hypothetical protein